MAVQKIHIRRAVLNDATVLAEFNKGIALETENIHLKDDVILAGVTALINDDSKGFYLIAEISGQIAGALMVTKEWSDWRNGEFWWIQSVYVKDEFRRQGIYSALYNHLKSLVRENGNVCGFRLYVEKENLVARSTYEKLGMTETVYRMYESETPGSDWQQLNK